MLEPEQILHASMILSVESEEEREGGVIIQIQEALGCDSSDYDAAMSHIEQHRDDGNWGGRREAILHRSRERLREAMNTDALPSDGPLAESLFSLIGDDDNGEIDPFAELGVTSNSGSVLSSNQIDNSDPLSAFMDDEDDEEQDMVDDSGFFTGDSSVGIDDEENVEDTPIEETENNVDEIEENDDEVEPEISANEGYEMLMATCWIDGILDPAEAKLLARKREELGITFEQHLDMLRNMLENSS